MPVKDGGRSISSEFEILFLKFREHIHNTASSFLHASYAKQVQDILSRSAGVGLPNTLSNDTILILFLREKEKTVKPALNLNEMVRNLTLNCLTKHCDDIFASTPNLGRHMQYALKQYVEMIYQDAVKQIAFELEKEGVPSIITIWTRSTRFVTKLMSPKSW